MMPLTSPRRMSLIAFLMLLMLLTTPNHAFSLNQLFKPEQKSQSIRASPVTEEAAAAAATPLLDWNISASGSIGSMLMQMQKKEEEMKKFNKTLLDKEQVLDLDFHNATTTSVPPDKEEQPKQSKELSKMDRETAKELDDAVKIRLSSSVGDDVEILELPPLYKILLQEDEAVDELPPLSKPEHYEERIGRDMRHLAVTIASSVDDVSDWVNVCNEFHPTGGLAPLIQCVREGASAIRKRHDDAEISDLVENKFEESFIAASTACRALRDLCALNLNLSAVITDGLLRANTAYAKEGSSLLIDLVTLLQYAHDNTEIAQTSRRSQFLSLGRPKTRPRSPRRSRKGKSRLKFPLIITSSPHHPFLFLCSMFNVHRDSTTM
jgi:hypothetical protein